MYIPREIMSIIHDYLIGPKQYHKENFDIVLLDIKMMGSLFVYTIPPTISYMCWGKGGRRTI